MNFKITGIVASTYEDGACPGCGCKIPDNAALGDNCEHCDREWTGLDYFEALYPLTDWQYEVANGDTVLGYEAWLSHKIESSKN